MRRYRRPCLVAVAVLAAAPSAGAHAFLQSASPAVGGRVATSPTAITLDYSEAVEPSFSSVTVSGPGGERADKGDLHVAADNPKRLILEVNTLAVGAYTVVWHVVSVDTHKTEGTYHFSVGGE